MQQPQPDQQVPEQMQYTSPQYQQLQQPIMLCPVQYVYEPLLPDEQGQPIPAPYQSQAYLLNVQNTPPWAQNRPNMVYMQQTMQPYMQQMVQPMYNYQYQPMILQKQIRQIVPSYMNQSVMNPQIVNQQMIQNLGQSQVMQSVASPQLMQNVAQNQVNQNQGMMNPNIIQNPLRFQMEKREMPILASMLNVRKSMNQNELVSMIRPQYQNVRPQMIIVNPIGKQCVHYTQKEPPPMLIEKQVKNDIQSIRSQVPEGLSVKTIKVPALVKPNENVIQNIALDDIHQWVNNKPKHLYNRDPQTNYKRKIQELLELNNRDGNEVLAKRMYPNNPDEQIFKMQVLMDTPPNTSEIQANNNTLPIVTTQIMNVKKQFEEKKLRNTVFVQARGRLDDVRVNDIQNVNYTNICNTGTNIANIMINNTSIENLNKNVVIHNTNLDLNRVNKNFNIVAVNSVMNNVMNLNNQSAERNIGSEININNIRNLEDVPMLIQMQSESNETEVNPHNQFISEQVVQNMKVEKIRREEEKILSLQDIEGVKEQNTDPVKNTKIISLNNRVTMTANKNTNNEDKLTEIISNENNTMTIKKLSNDHTRKEEKQRKSKEENAKVTETEVTLNKSITNYPQAANIELSNDLQSKSTMTFISKLPEDNSIIKSTTTDMSIMAKNVISTDTNQYKPDATNDDTKEKRGKREIKKKSKLAKFDEVEVEVEKENKLKKPKRDKNFVMMKRSSRSRSRQRRPSGSRRTRSRDRRSCSRRSRYRSRGRSTHRRRSRDHRSCDRSRDRMRGRSPYRRSRSQRRRSRSCERSPYRHSHSHRSVTRGRCVHELPSRDHDTRRPRSRDRACCGHSRAAEVQKPWILPLKGKPIVREERVGVYEKTEEKREDIPVGTEDNTVVDSIPVKTEEKIEASIRVETVETSGEVSSNTDTEKDKLEERNKTEHDKPDTSGIDEDSPFKDLKKNVVETWTISEVTSHLMKHASWRDTALKLADQEIDGESLLLANKDQLIQIDICEEQAQEISEFLEQVQ